MNKFGYKNDTIELVELGQFLRDTTKYRVEREWFIVFEKKTGDFVGYAKTTQKSPHYVYRTPDLMLIDKKKGELVLVIEIDGDIHRVKEFETDSRNTQYAKAKIPLLVISKWEIETTIFDYITKKLGEIL